MRGRCCRGARAILLAGLFIVWIPALGAEAVGPDLDGLLSVMDRLRQEGHVPAMGLVVVVDGKPAVVAGLGRATPVTPFRWGSITKSFTALAALCLVRDGRITLETPVRSVIGDGYFTNPWSATEPVRLLHLLTLSAGFADLSRTEWDTNAPLPLWTALARYAPERVAHWPPGLQFSYSNAPPGLTAAVIERVSGVGFEGFLAERVFAPLGMDGASLAPVPDLPGGYRADGETEIPYWHMTYPAFGALNASIRDLSRFLTALVNDGRVPGVAGLPGDLISRFLGPQDTPATVAGLEVGYGAGIYGWVRDGHVFLGHGGDADGYRARYGALPTHGRGYAVVIDTDNPRLLRRLERVVETALVRDLTAQSLTPRTDLDLSGYAGSYYPSSSRFGRTPPSGGVDRAEITVSGSSLRFRYRGRTTELYPVGSDRFIRAGDPAVTVVFLRHNGQLFLEGELGNFVNLSTGSCPDFLGACE